MISDKLNSPVFITGCERSGSSIIARIISMCGGFTGEVTDMHENIYIKKMVDDYYKAIQLNPKGQYPMPDTKRLFIPTDWKQEVETILHNEKYKNERWMYKSSRISQLWPIWDYAYPDAKWIIVRRRTPDIIQSCLKTGFMTAFASKGYQKAVGADNEADGWKWWIHQHEKLFVEMMEHGLNCKVVWPERMVTGNYQQIYEMLEWLGLEWNENIVTLTSSLLKKERSV